MNITTATGAQTIIIDPERMQVEGLYTVQQPRKLVWLLAVLSIGWLPALINPEIVQVATDLYPTALGSTNPYWVGEHIGTVYCGVPVVTISACLLFLSPGLFLSLAFNAGKSVGEWIFSGLLLSIIVVSVVAGMVQAFIGYPLRGSTFAYIVMGCAFLSFVLVVARLNAGQHVPWPLNAPHSINTVMSFLIVPVLILIFLAPKFLWEDFNGDGAHAYESARLLLVQALPFWSESAGEIASFPGITSMLFAFPSSWFIRFFGEIEYSARAPFLLFLVALYGVMLTLIEYGRGKGVGICERWLLWGGMVIYVVVVGFSATYNPYHADIALPATQDTLLMVCFFGFTLAFMRKELMWATVYMGLTYLSSPGGQLLLGFWLVAVSVLLRPRPWPWIILNGLILFGWMGLGILFSMLLPAIGWPAPGGEHSLSGSLGRFAWLQFTDWGRIELLLWSTGILPTLALLTWRWQDNVAKILAAVTIIHFGFFYIQYHINLHYFVPAILMSIIVFWRSRPTWDPRFRQYTLLAMAITSIWSFMVSLPEHGEPFRTARLVGSTIEDRIGGYENIAPGVFKRSQIFAFLFPYSSSPHVPQKSFGGSPLVWNFYAHRHQSSERSINYILQRAVDSPATGMHLLVNDGDTALYVKSDRVWAEHLGMRPPTPAGSRKYVIRPEVLYRGRHDENDPILVDLQSWLRRFELGNHLLKSICESIECGKKS